MMRSLKLAKVGLWVIALLVGTGCDSCILKPCSDPIPTTSVPVEKLVGDFNANASAVPKLWAKARIQATLVDNKGRSFTWGATSPLTAPNGTLLLGKGANKFGPYDFVLIGKEGPQEIFRLGSSIEQNKYYLRYQYGDKGHLWVGRLDLAGAPGVKIPIDPNQLASVLCVTELPNDLSQIPTVGLTLDNTPCAYKYVLTYIDRQPVSKKLMLRREMLYTWSDKVPPDHPFQINLLDSTGKRVMIATLKDYKPIGVGEGQKAPVMPTDIDITWPGTGNRIHLVLSDMTVSRGDPSLASPLDETPGLETTFVDEDVVTGDRK